MNHAQQKIGSILVHMEQLLDQSNNLHILGIASSEERRVEINAMIDLGGEKWPTYQHSKDNRVAMSTITYPFVVSPESMRGHSRFLILLDSKISDAFYEDRKNRVSDEIRVSLHRVAQLLRITTADLFVIV